MTGNKEPLKISFAKVNFFEISFFCEQAPFYFKKKRTFKKSTEICYL